VRPEEIEGVHFWQLKVEDQRRIASTYFYFDFQVGKVTWFVPPWRASKRALERQEILAN
jgi:hypothetical protein